MKIGFDVPRTRRWIEAVFGTDALTDIEERALRFKEESTELCEALGLTREQAHAVVDQVYDKGEPGEPFQELGGTLVTLQALCAVVGLDPDVCGNAEENRCEQPAIMDKIRTKWVSKAVVSSTSQRNRP